MNTITDRRGRVWRGNAGAEAAEELNRFDDALALGAAIRERRTAIGVGLREFARVLGISHATLSRLERGDAGVVGDDTLGAIASELRVDGATRARWSALNGRLPSDLVSMLLAHPDRWDAIRALLSSTP